MHRGRIYFGVQAVAGAVWWVAVFASPVIREATLGNLNPFLVAAFDIPLSVLGSAVATSGMKSAAVVSASWTSIVAVTLAVYATITTLAGWGAIVMAAAAACSLIALSLIVLRRVPTNWLISGPFAFHPASAGSTTGNYVARTFAQIFVFWALFLVVIPACISAIEQRWSVAISFPQYLAGGGVAILVLASALGVWSGVVMSTSGKGTPLPSAMPNRLVIAGPYRWVRNPMAVAGIVQGVAVGLIFGSWLVVAYAILGSVLWNYAIRPHEEADLNERFGPEFRTYQAVVRCWLPRAPLRSHSGPPQTGHS